MTYRRIQSVLGSRSRVLALIFALTVAMVAVAQSTPIQVALERFQIVEVTEDGETREERISAFELEPGHVLEEVVTVTNTSDEDLSDIVLVLPVPEGTSFLANTALAIDVSGILIEPEFSFDGGATYAVPPLVRVEIVEEDGRRVEREIEVRPEEYTHARWVLPTLETQSTATARLRAVVR